MTLQISVITPSFNQVRYLPVCIESVHAQSVAPLEHIVLDPGSTDGSLELLQRDRRITLVVGEDTSQSDAINKGVRLASGDIIAWLNSDDCYVDHRVFARVIEVFQAEPEVDIAYGTGDYIDERGRVLREFYINADPGSLSCKLGGEVGIAQPATFFRRRLFDDLGGLDEQLKFSMDHDLWLRAALAGKRFVSLDSRLAKTRVHGETKTFGSRDDSFREVAENVVRRIGFLPSVWAERWAKAIVTETDGIISDPGADRLEEVVNRNVAATCNEMLRAFNYPATARAALRRAAQDPGYDYGRSTVSAMASDPEPMPPVSRLALFDGQPDDRQIVSRAVNGVGYHFDGVEVDRHQRRSAELLDELRKQARPRAVVLGNGPSLLNVRAEDLAGSTVFGSNYVFLNRELWPAIDILSITNPLVAAQRAGVINRLDGLTVAFPWWLCAFLSPRSNTLLLPADGDEEFSLDPTSRISWCHTVTYFNLQLAYALGCREVVMAGFDHYYTQSPDLVEGDTIEPESRDTNHFDPAYFGSKRWHAADVAGMEKVYWVAKRAFEADGRRIVNGTVGGHLEIFERVDLASMEQL